MRCESDSELSDDESEKVDSRWYFSDIDLENSPSRKCKISQARESKYRERISKIIQSTGEKLKLPQIVMDIATVYMHRFFMFHSMTEFSKTYTALSALLLASKTTDLHQCVLNIIKCLVENERSDEFHNYVSYVLFYEHIMLQTLGFELDFEHPYKYVEKYCKLLRESQDFIKKCKIMVTESIHKTTISLQHDSRTMAIFCMHLTYQITNKPIRTTKNGKPWFSFFNEKYTTKFLEDLSKKYSSILGKFHNSKNPKNTLPMVLSENSNDSLSFVNSKMKTIDQNEILNNYSTQNGSIPNAHSTPKPNLSNNSGLQKDKTIGEDYKKLNGFSNFIEEAVESNETSQKIPDDNNSMLLNAKELSIVNQNGGENREPLINRVQYTEQNSNFMLNSGIPNGMQMNIVMNINSNNNYEAKKDLANHVDERKNRNLSRKHERIVFDLKDEEPRPKRFKLIKKR